MSHFGLFVTCDRKFLPCVNALLNSLEKREIKDVSVVLSYYDFPEEYIERAINEFSYEIVPIEIKRSDYEIKEFDMNSFMKQSKHRIIRMRGEEFDAICHIDADQFVVSRNFVNLLELVKGTRKMIVPNEGFKWKFTERYMHQGKRIIDKDITALKFHCGSPAFLDLKEWTQVFDVYNQLAFNSFEIDESKGINKPIGDMYCWNISVYKCGREDDVVLLPMECLTQVHQTNSRPHTRISIREGDFWITEAGDEVYAVHGKVGNREFHDGIMRHVVAATNDSEQIARTERAVRLIQKEWYDLNFRQVLNLYDYVPKNDYWEEFRH